MRVKCDDARFRISIDGETDEIRDCLKDIVLILHKGYKGRSTTPFQIKTDLGSLESLTIMRQYVFDDLERISYDGTHIRYRPLAHRDERMQAVAQHYQILKQILHCP